MDSPVSSRISSPMSRPKARPATTNSRVRKLTPSKTGDGDKRKREPLGRITMDDVFKLMESKQWKDRKSALEELSTTIKESKFSRSSDFGKVIKCLRTMIMNDSNVLLVSKAVQCISAMAYAEDFEPHAPLMTTVLLEKFKEKKACIVEAVREAVDSIYLNTPFGQIFRYVKIYLSHQNASVKAETELFIQRCFTKPFQCLMSKAYWEPIASLLVSNLASTETIVRENAIKAIGAMMKVVGEDAMLPFMDNIPRHQREKIADVHLGATVDRNASEIHENKQSGSVDQDQTDPWSSACSYDQDHQSTQDTLLKKRSLSTYPRERAKSMARGRETTRSTQRPPGSPVHRMPYSLSPSRGPPEIADRSPTSDSLKTWSPDRETLHLRKESSTAGKIDMLLEELEKYVSSCSVQMKKLKPALLRENKRIDISLLNNRLESMEELLKLAHF